MDSRKLKGIIEALLFSSQEPVAIDRIKEVLGEENTVDIRKLIGELKAEYNQTNRAFMIIEIAGGFQTCTRPEYAVWLKKLYKSRQSQRLSIPALETLAIIVYNQPITRVEIESIRGVNVEGVLRTLLEKDLVKIRGRKEGVGRPIIYGTTRRFLEYFGLNSLSELPTLQEVKVKMNSKEGLKNEFEGAAQQDRPDR
jgi:segregation and condensation protein B